MALINKLYKTKIDCSTYEAQIDSTNTIITVTVIDFNNNPVSNAPVTISASKGEFIKKENNSSSSNVSELSSVSMNTGSNGIAKFTYQASEWGFITITANNNTVNLFVTGWRQNIPDEFEFESEPTFDDTDALINTQYYVDESINHIIFQSTMADMTFEEKSGYWSSNLGLFTPYKVGETLPTLLPNEQTFNATQNSNKTYSIGLDNVYGTIWSLEWDMKTSMTSAIICVGLTKSVNIGTSTFDDYIALGVWSDGKITIAMKETDFPIDKESYGNWELNTWHHCKIECNEDHMYSFICDGETLAMWGVEVLTKSYNYAIYLDTWKVGTVNLKNISFTNNTSPYLPSTNIKNIIYRPDIVVSMDSHGLISARSEMNAHPVENTFRLDWDIIHHDMNYIPSENYMN